MRKNYKNGFTLIEVSLVIAVAGLIFLMVFTALPQLQRQRRDADRREDLLTLIKEIKSYQENNRGSLPTWDGISSALVINGSSPGSSSWGKFYSNYLGSTFTDPLGKSYNLIVMQCDRESSINAGENCTNYPSYPVSSLASQSFPNNYNIYVILQSSCSGETPIKTSNPRSVSALYRLEGAGVYCANT